VRDEVINLTRYRTSYPRATKSAVSASSSSGCVAGFVARKSSTGSTSPRPIRWYQTRFTCAFANSGFFGDVIHAASASSRLCSPDSATAPSPSSRVFTGAPVRGSFTPPSSDSYTTCSPTNSCPSLSSRRRFSRTL
jgi:hypothetical protein